MLCSVTMNVARRPRSTVNCCGETAKRPPGLFAGGNGAGDGGFGAGGVGAGGAGVGSGPAGVGGGSVGGSGPGGFGAGGVGATGVAVGARTSTLPDVIVVFVVESSHADIANRSAETRRSRRVDVGNIGPPVGPSKTNWRVGEFANSPTAQFCTGIIHRVMRARQWLCGIHSHKLSARLPRLRAHCKIESRVAPRACIVRVGIS
jgi:hypothetical protein